MLRGFDTSAYPGNSTMQALRQFFDFTGVYLGPAPSHQNTGWMTEIPTLRQMGYRMLPVFVGQQVIGPGAKNPSVANGILDAKRAAQLMASAGFNHLAPVYLDLENGAPMPQLERDYVAAWVSEVRALGYAPGVYCSHVLSTLVVPLKCLIWDFHVPTTDRTYQVLPQDAPPPLPAGLAARQYRQNVVLRGTGILVDLNQAPDASGLAV
jgi:hypothetical protein